MVVMMVMAVTMPMAMPMEMAHGVRVVGRVGDRLHLRHRHARRERDRRQAGDRER